MSPPLRGLTTAIVLSALGAAALVVNAGMAVANLRRISESYQRVTHTHEVLQELHTVEDQLRDAERLQRDLVLTGDDEYLTPYAQHAQEVESSLSRLRLLTMDDAAQQLRIEELKPVVARRLELLQLGIHQQRRGPDGAERVRRGVLGGEGKQVMEDVLRRLRLMKGSEEALLARRSRASVVAWKVALASVLLGLGANLVLVTAAYAAFRARVRERQEDGRRKDEFLAVLAHELRNPLTAMRNAIAVLGHVTPGAEQAGRARLILDRQTTHLAKLVDELLDVARIQSGKIRLQRQPVDLAEVVRGAAQDVRPMYDGKALALEVRLPPAPVWVDGDPTRLSQVTTNLLFNAWKFTGGGGHVVVQVAAEEGRALLRVRDDGAGLDAAILSRLFQPFAQADATLHRTAGGLGLGLALARSIVELHEGAIRASSDGPGQGAEFVVDLPLVQGPPRAVCPAAENRKVRPVRVLVIEDNEDSAAGLREYLELRGHVVAVAHDGSTGLEVAREWDPDVVVCDVGLPGIDGYEVARQLRAGGSRARLIALTGYARSADVELARRAGFDDHLAKPADLEQLSASLAGMGPRGAGQPAPVAMAPPA